MSSWSGMAERLRKNGGYAFSEDFMFTDFEFTYHTDTENCKHETIYYRAYLNKDGSVWYGEWECQDCKVVFLNKI